MVNAFFGLPHWNITRRKKPKCKKVVLFSWLQCPKWFSCSLTHFSFSLPKGSPVVLVAMSRMDFRSPMTRSFVFLTSSRIVMR